MELNAPIIAYIGQEGWCMGLVRPGSQHSQNDFIPFLNTVIHRSRRFTQNGLLLRLDSAHLSVINETEYGKQRLIIRIIKRTADSVGQMFLTPDYEHYVQTLSFVIQHQEEESRQ